MDPIERHRILAGGAINNDDLYGDSISPDGEFDAEKEVIRIYGEDWMKTHGAPCAVA